MMRPLIDKLIRLHPGQDPDQSSSYLPTLLLALIFRSMMMEPGEGERVPLVMQELLLVERGVKSVPARHSSPPSPPVRIPKAKSF